MQHPVWNYRVIDDVTESSLNALGEDGWEIVASIGTLRVIAKRPALDFREQVTLDQRRRYFGYLGLNEPDEGVS